MAHTDHSKLRKSRKDTLRESRTRHDTKAAIQRGDFDGLPTRMPTRALRTRVVL